MFFSIFLLPWHEKHDSIVIAQRNYIARERRDSMALAPRDHLDEIRTW